MNKKQIGRFGEEWVAGYISDKGYAIIEKNYRNKIGEIDLICKDKSTIVFIEVKTRKSLSFGFGEESVNKKKINKIRTVALAYLQDKKSYNNVDYRFDVIALYLSDNNLVERYNHIIGAF